MAPQNPAPFRHDFDEVVERRGTGSVKWNRYSPDVLPMWVADSDFKAPAPVREVLQAQVEHGVFGYADGFDRALEKAAAVFGEPARMPESPDRVQGGVGGCSRFQSAPSGAAPGRGSRVAG